MSSSKEKPVIYLQYKGREVTLDHILALVKENYSVMKQGDDQIKEIKVYLKPEDAKTYYVINETFAGEVGLFET